MVARTISIILQADASSPYSDAEFQKTFDSIENQYYRNFQVILYGDHPYAKKVAQEKNYSFIDTTFDSNAKALNLALQQATGDLVLLCNNRLNVIEFKKSACTFYNMIAERHPNFNLLYTDYDLIDNALKKERKLLEFHRGRILDTWDLGFCLLFRRAFLSEIGFADEAYKFNPLYDIRLKAFETGKIIHISDRFNGVPYNAWAAPKAHDVFAYLKEKKEVALELEEIATQHLKRIGAYLAPGQNYRAVTYTPEEEASFADCLVTVAIPVFNRPLFIGPAIESIQAQTVQNIEVVVVCNGGEDDPTIPEVRRYMEGGDLYQPDKPRVRLMVYDLNIIGMCLNAALQTSKAKYYMQLDSDDLLFENAVEKILKVYEQDDRIGMVIGSYQVFEKKASGEIVPVLQNNNPFIVTHPEWTEENGRNNLLRIGGAGAPRSIKIKVLEELGWFGMNDAPYCRNYGEDYELVNRVAEKYRIGRVWDPIYKVVRHEDGTDHNINQATIDINDNAKDDMRLKAIRRRQKLNGALEKKINLSFNVNIEEE